MRTIIKILLWTFGLGLVLFLFISLLGIRKDIVKGVTGDKIKQIKLGWTLEQVLATLGRPYNIEASIGLHDNECPRAKPRLEIEVINATDIRQTVNIFYNDTNFCCEGNKIDLQTKGVTLTYTRPVLLAKYYPMLWIHFDKYFKVNSVYAVEVNQLEEFEGVDDQAIYSMPSAYDRVTFPEVKNEIRSYINEKKYFDYFEDGN